MTRLEYTENFRIMRHLRDRAPVENAFYALIALSHDDRQAFADTFNRHHEAQNLPTRIAITPKPCLGGIEDGC